MVLDGISSQEYPVNTGDPEGSIFGHTLFLLYINDQGISGKEKNSAFYTNWEIICSQGSGHTVIPLNGFSGGKVGKALETFTIFSLKLL